MKFTNILSLALFTAVGFTSCSKSDNAPKTPAPKAEPTEPALKVAYVDLDSLQKNYAYFQEAQAALDAKSKQYDSELNRLGQDLQNSMVNFQTQMQNGTINSQQAYEKAEKNLANKQQNLESKRAQYAQNLMTEQESFNLALQDSLNNFIAEYNKSKKFDIILSKAGSNILYANPKMDITKEVIDGLNKRYKKK